MAVRVKVNQNGIQDIKKQSMRYLDLVAKRIRDKAKELVPVDSGELRKSIEVSDGSGGSQMVGSDLDYSMIVELRQPYLRPALDVVMAQEKVK